MTIQERIGLFGGLILAFALVGATAFVSESCHSTSGTQAEHNAAVASGEAHAHETQAQASDHVAADLQATVDRQKQDLGRLTAERDALLRKLAAKQKPRPSDADPVPGVGSMEVYEAAIADRDEVIAKDAEVIKAQGDHIGDLTVMIGTLTVSRDEWKKAFEASERRAIAQEAATAAWKKAVVSSKWSGRVQGFAAGIAVGFWGSRR